MASKLETNFSDPPYYNDYDEGSNFHRVLFRPGVALQSRELSEVQDILQDQITRHGNYTFKDGTIVRGCTFTLDQGVGYIKFPDLNSAGQEINVSQITGGNTVAYEPTNDIVAEVIDGAEGLESQNPDLKTIFVKYRTASRAINNTQSAFESEDTIYFINRDAEVATVTMSSTTNINNLGSAIEVYQSTTGATATVTVVNSTAVSLSSINGYFTNTYSLSFANSTANAQVETFTLDNSYLKEVAQIASNTTFGDVSNTRKNTVGTAFNFIVTDGVVFQKGHFVNVNKQSIIVDKYSITPQDAYIGFYTNEQVVNSSSNSSLVDPASGFSNENAPGADRLKLTPTLVNINAAAAAANSNFLPLVAYSEGSQIVYNDAPVLNKLGQTLARRTREESGNYVVQKFSFNTRPRSTNNDFIQAVSGPGIAYVDGYRIEATESRYVNVRKGLDTNSLNNQSLFTNYQGVVHIDQAVGHFDFKAGQEINLHDTDPLFITNDSDYEDGIGTANISGAIIGTARIRSIEKYTGQSGTPAGQFKAYLFDIQMNEGQRFNDVNALSQGANGSYTAIGTVEADADGNRLRGAGSSSLVFRTGINAVKQISDASIITRTHGTVSVPVGGEASLTIASPDSLPYGVGDPSPSRNDFLFVPQSSFRRTSTLSGTIESFGNTSVSGTSTAFTTELVVGQYIYLSGPGTIHRITRIDNDSSLRVDPFVSTSSAGQTVSYAFPADIPVDLEALDDVIDVTVGAGANTVSFNFGGAVNTGVTADVSFNKKITSASFKGKTFPTGGDNTSWVYLDITSDKAGPWSLSVADVHKIEAVYGSSSGTDISGATDITASFTLDNGQRKDYYGLARLLIKPSASISLATYDYLVVQFKYFEHGAGEFFSVDSYPVDDTTTTLPTEKIRTEDIPIFRSVTGDQFDLRDCIDFRPRVVDNVTPGANVSVAVEAGNSTVTFSSSDKVFPAPNERFDYDIEYYLPRKDLLTLSSVGVMSTVEGTSSAVPVLPSLPQGEMAIGEIHVPAFPSLDAETAKSAKRSEYLVRISSTQPRRYTMEDIGQLDRRITNLEYYASLNALERQALESVIPSEVNSGVDRFKNGIFVDGFNNTLAADLNNDELKSIPGFPYPSSIAPSVRNTALRLTANTTASSGVSIKNFTTLDYSQEVLISQPLASRSRNLLEDVFHWEGQARVFPNFDNYYDESITPTNIDIDLATPFQGLIDELVDVGVPLNWSFDEVVSRESLGQTTLANGRRRTLVEDFLVTSRTVTSSFEVSENEQFIPVGEFVRDIKLNPYMKSRDVLVAVTGLRPGMYHRVYFGDTDVTQHCVPVKMVGASNDRYINSSTADTYLNDQWDQNPNQFLSVGTIGTFQSTLTLASGSIRPAGFEADIDGTLLVKYTIPSNTFYVGNHKITISDAINYKSLDSSLSLAYGEYNAYNFAVQKDSVSLSPSLPEFDRVTSYSDPIVTSERSTISTWFIPPPPPENDGRDGGGNDGAGNCVPLTQTIFVDQSLAGAEDGVYLSSIDLYFATKAATGGVNVYLRVVENGMPTAVKLPNSSASVKAANINTSSDASVATTFTFDSPVYLRSAQEYAVIIHPEDGSPEYQVYTYETGARDLTNPTIRNVANFNSGNMFLSTNARNFMPVNNEDVKITFRRANYGNANTGTATFHNDNYEFFELSNISGTFSTGETVAVVSANAAAGTATVSSKKTVVGMNDIITTLENYLAGTQTVDIHGNSIETNYNVDGSGATPSNADVTLLRQYSLGLASFSSLDPDFVKYIRNNFYVSNDSNFNKNYVYGTSTAFDTDFDNGDTIIVEDVNGTKQENIVIETPANSSVLVVRDAWRLQSNADEYDTLSGLSYYSAVGDSTAKILRGKVINYNSTKATMIINGSTAANQSFAFSNGQGIEGMTSGATADINVVNKQVSHLQFLNNKVEVPGTSINANLTIATQVGSNTGSISSNVVFGGTIYYNENAVVKSRSNEIRDDAGAKSVTATYTLSSFSPRGRTTPALATTSVAVNTYENLTQATVTGETGTNGTSTAKYVSRVITLKDGLDAEDIRVFMDAYRPANTNIDVYVKILSLSDNAEFVDKDWTLLSYSNNTIDVRSSSTDRYDINEYELSFDTKPPTVDVLGTGLVDSGNNKIAFGSASSKFSVGDVVLINDSSDDDYFVSTVTAANSTVLTIANEFTYAAEGQKKIRKATQPNAAFKYNQNDNIVRYIDGNLAPNDTYKQFAIKIVMRADNHYQVPRVENVRAIAVSV